MGMILSVSESGSKCFWKVATKASINCLARGLLGSDSVTLARNCSIPACIIGAPRLFAPVRSINWRMLASFERATFSDARGPEDDCALGFGAAVFSWARTRIEGNCTTRIKAQAKSPQVTTSFRIGASLAHERHLDTITPQPDKSGLRTCSGLGRLSGMR